MGCTNTNFEINNQKIPDKEFFQKLHSTHTTPDRSFSKHSTISNAPRSDNDLINQAIELIILDKTKYSELSNNDLVIQINKIANLYEEKKTNLNLLTNKNNYNLNSSKPSKLINNNSFESDIEKICLEMNLTYISGTLAFDIINRNLPSMQLETFSKVLKSIFHILMEKCINELDKRKLIFGFVFTLRENNDLNKQNMTEDYKNYMKENGYKKKIMDGIKVAGVRDENSSEELSNFFINFHKSLYIEIKNIGNLISEMKPSLFFLSQMLLNFLSDKNIPITPHVLSEYIITAEEKIIS